MSLLEVSDLVVAYGNINAVKNISLSIEPGELVCLIGANGAGKSTTLKTLAGMMPAKSGEIRYRTQSIRNMPSHQLTRQGIALVPEGRGIFGRLTVDENLEMGAYIRNDRDIRNDMRHIYDLFPRLHERRDQKAGTLSGGEQQMLAIGRAMMSRPTLLLLDEPSMGLAPIMVRKIFEIIRHISSQGTTILLVEQNARMALTISHRAYVMESGCITLSDSADALLGNPRVQHAYLGE